MPKPIFFEVIYGPHRGHILVFWKGKSDELTPLALIIHGGGWQDGSKERVNRFVDVQTLLDAGISVAANNYRLNAAEWNIYMASVGLAGTSAGACTSLWLAYHDDLADPESEDPVARQTSKPQHVTVRGAQTTLDPEQMKKWTPNSIYGGHAFGKKDFETFLAERASILPWINEYSPYALVGKDAPPVASFYDSPPAMRKEQEDPTHTANFGVGLQQRCLELRVECIVVYPRAPGVSYTGFATKQFTEYLIEKLANPGKSASPPAGEYPLSLAEIRVRDPFIFADRESQTYYLYAQGGNCALNDDADLGVEVYRSRDLVHWSEPRTVFDRPKKGFWGRPGICRGCRTTSAATPGIITNSRRPIPPAKTNGRSRPYRQKSQRRAQLCHLGHPGQRPLLSASMTSIRPHRCGMARATTCSLSMAARFPHSSNGHRGLFQHRLVPQESLQPSLLRLRPRQRRYRLARPHPYLPLSHHRPGIEHGHNNVLTLDISASHTGISTRPPACNRSPAVRHESPNR